MFLFGFKYKLYVFLLQGVINAMINEFGLLHLTISLVA